MKWEMVVVLPSAVAPYLADRWEPFAATKDAIYLKRCVCVHAFEYRPTIVNGVWATVCIYCRCSA